jgi:hypothetical protein
MQFNRRLFVRVACWCAFIVTVAAVLVACIFTPWAIVWMAAIMPVEMSAGLSAAVLLIFWLNYRDLKLLGPGIGRIGRCLSAPVIGTLLITCLYVAETFVRPHYTTMWANNITLAGTTTTCAALLAGAAAFLKALASRDRRRGMKLVLLFFVLAIQGVMAPVVLVQEKDAIHFFLARPFYDAQLSRMEAGEMQFHVWDWGRIDALVLNTEGIYLVYDEADQIALPGQERSAEWISMCTIKSDLCAAGGFDAPYVQRFDEHYYLVVTDY